MAPRRAERAAQADLAPALVGDDHDVRYPDRADEQRDGSEADEQRSELALRRGAGLERIRGHRDGEPVRALRVGGGREQRRGLGDLVLLGAHEHLRRSSVSSARPLGDRQPDEDAAVEVRGEADRRENADHREPGAAEVHLDPVADSDDLQRACRLRAEHHGRKVRSGPGRGSARRKPDPSAPSSPSSVASIEIPPVWSVGTNGVRNTLTCETS